MTDEDKERVKFNTEIIKTLIILFLATGGGTISLILEGLPRGRHVVFAAGGIMLALISGVMTYVIYKNTKKLIK